MSKKAEGETPVTQAGQELEQQAVQEQSAGAQELIELSGEEFEQVKAHIESLTQERDEMKTLAQRVQADFDNFRRRNAAVYADAQEEGARNVIKALLPALDTFDRALENAEGVDVAWLEGMEKVQRQLLESLGKCGLRAVPEGGQFDPNLHEAVLQEEAEGVPSGQVLQTLQKGYQVNDRMIRHSMVKVAK
ncbi:MAG: nucleotide exchange factor GrpE [Christensenellaceae bacterium]|jgi:molecular chaperone GrpE|nr:nucleotide exchange factor GrpE [Christensenellaceae bacterium]